MRHAIDTCYIQCPDYFTGQLFLPAYLLEKAKREQVIYAEIYGTIPQDVRKSVGRFPERQFSLLSFCARCPGALDLLDSTPALMLANSWVFREPVQRPLRSARALLRKKQREQLRWLSFCIPSEAAVRVLRKVPPEICTVELLLYLKDAMAMPENLKLLSHVPRINRGLVRIISDPGLLALATPNLLAEIGLCRDEDRRAHLAYDLFDFISLSNCAGQDPFKTPFQSIRKFHEKYRSVADEVQRWRLLAYLKGLKFPKPPLAGTEDIIPLDTVEQLVLEGKRQQHCIAKYAHAIAAGRLYAYQIITVHEHATATIAEGNNHGKVYWKLRKCRGASNTPITPAARAKVLA